MSGEYEDILSDSLELLGGKPVIDDEIVRYGPMLLRIAPKHRKLIASGSHSSCKSPSIFLAERIERGLLTCEGATVLELGAGTALPSLLLSTSPNSPTLVVVTDYPDEIILGNLRNNVIRNEHLVSSKCRLVAQGYDWGADTSPLLSLLPSTDASGYEILILSDLLHFGDCHDMLIKSIISLLKRSPESRVHVSAGVYTKPAVCNNFLTKSRDAGLHLEEIITDPSEPWMGKLAVEGLDPTDLAIRKANCRYWIGKWAAGTNIN